MDPDAGLMNSGLAMQTLNFALELASLFSLARWGWHLDAALELRWLAAVGAPVAALLCLGLWATPRSPFRLGGPARFVFQAVFYGAVCWALLSQGAAMTALIFAGLVAALWAASFALRLRGP